MQGLVSWAALSQAGSNLGHVNITAGANVVCVMGVEKWFCHVPIPEGAGLLCRVS